MTGFALKQENGSPAPANLPPTSLIICSRNRPKMLAEAVQAILSGDEVPTEIIIVDQSDVPHPHLRTLTPDRASELRYLWTHSVGLSRANNYGIAAAQHDVLVFTHDDVSVTPSWFGLLVRSLVNSGQRAVVTGRVLATAEAPGNFAPSTTSSRSLPPMCR